jgi:hypothetical protein
MDGVIAFNMPRDNTLVITFDDGKTKLADIQQALKKGGLAPLGNPVYLK